MITYPIQEKTQVDNHCFMLLGRIQDFRFSFGGGGAPKIICGHTHHKREARSPLLPGSSSWVGGGGGRQRLYAGTHITSAKPEVPYCRGPALGGGGGGRQILYAGTHITSAKPEVPLLPGSSSRFFLMLSRRAIWTLFLSILIQNGI